MSTCVYRRRTNPRTHSERVVRLVHADAVHADLDGVSCGAVHRPVGEVQLDGLNGANGRPETQAQSSRGASDVGRVVGSAHSLVQHVKELVEDVWAEHVTGLCGRGVGRAAEEGALPPGQTGRRVPASEDDTYVTLRPTGGKHRAPPAGGGAH